MANAGPGARVRKFRELRQAGIEELAERTGLAPSLLRAVEEGEPALSSHEGEEPMIVHGGALGRENAEVCAVLYFPQ